MPWGKWWLQIETPGPVGTIRGRPREEVEWMRRASAITLCRLQMPCSAYILTNSYEQEISRQ